MNPTRRYKFGIGVLLFAMVVVAGYFRGVKRGEAVRYDTTLSSVVYQTRGLITGDQPTDVQMADIAKLIKSSVAPNSWIERGGTASLDMYSSNQSFVVNQCGAEHEKIRELLESLQTVAKEKRYSVDYDVSEILNAGTQNASYEQLDTLCAVTHQTMIDLGTEEFKLTPDANTITIRAVARNDVHSLLATYLDQLRSARRVFARIDG